MIRIPTANRKWTVGNSTDIYGSAVQAKNIDFDKAGYAALANKAMALYSKDSNPNFQNIIAMAADATYLYVVSTASFFLIQLASMALTAQEVLSGAPPTFGVNSDIEFFTGKPCVSGTTNVSTFDPSIIGFAPWVSKITGLNASYPHPLCKHEGRQTLLVGDGNVVHQYDTTFTEDTSDKLTIPSDYVVTGIRYKANNAYIFTRNIAGGNAKLFVWNGSGVGNNGAFGVAADWIYSGCEYGSYVAIVTSAGQILEFNGAGFTPLENFPVYNSQYPWTSSNSTANVIGNVANRGMEALGDILYINVNGALNSGQASIAGAFLPGMLSGLWKYDPTVGLYHSAGLNYAQKAQLQASGVATNAVTFTVPHQAQTGDPVFCVAKSGITQARSGQTYFAIYIGPNAVQLALTPAEALAGKCVTLTGTPDSGDLFAFDTYNSMGGSTVANAGPLFVMKSLVTDLFYAAIVLFAGVAFDNALAQKGVLNGLGLGRNVGYFVTPKIPPAGVLDTFQKILSKFPQLNQASEKIILKWRNSERIGAPSHAAFFGPGGTFTSSTTFTVNPAQKDIQTAIVGDEIEIISGAAAGYLAHITAIDSTSPTAWIITIDETLPVSNGDQMDFIFDNWIKYTPINSGERTNAQNFAERAIGKTGTWVQFKVAMYGRDVQIEELSLISAPNKLPE